MMVHQLVGRLRCEPTERSYCGLGVAVNQGALPVVPGEPAQGVREQQLGIDELTGDISRGLLVVAVVLDPLVAPHRWRGRLVGATSSQKSFPLNHQDVSNVTGVLERRPGLGVGTRSERVCRPLGEDVGDSLRRCRDDRRGFRRPVELVRETTALASIHGSDRSASGVVTLTPRSKYVWLTTPDVGKHTYFVGRRSRPDRREPAVIR